MNTIIEQETYLGVELSRTETEDVFLGMTNSEYRLCGYLLRGRYGETIAGMKDVVNAVAEHFREQGRAEVRAELDKEKRIFAAQVALIEPLARVRAAPTEKVKVQRGFHDVSDLYINKEEES
jgi:hypothetical protein